MGIAETLTPRRLRWIGAIGLALVLVFVGYGVGLWTSSEEHPGESSAEVGFLRDMSEHHAQAVEMGMIAYRRATLAEVSTLGGDIASDAAGADRHDAADPAELGTRADG